MTYHNLERQVKAVKKQLKTAIGNQDNAALEQAIEDAKELDLVDDPDVIKAQGVLDYARCSEGNNDEKWFHYRFMVLYGSAGFRGI